MPGPRRGNQPFDQTHLGTRVDPLDRRRVGQDAPQDSLDRPLHGGHRRDTEALVDGGPPRVVDPGHNPVDPVGLLGDAGDHDVGVVTVGHGRHRDGVGDAGFVEPVTIEAHTDDLLAGEPRIEPPERRFLPVDDRHGVARGFDGLGQARTHSATADHDDMHDGALY